MAGRGPRKPTSIGRLTEQVLRDLRPDDTDLAIVTSAWSSAVGDAIGRHAVPIGVRGGVLHVRCDSGAWASELRALSTDVLAGLQRSAPSVRLRSLRTSIGRIEVAEAASQSLPEPRQPPSPAELEQAHRAVAGIADGEMRAALERAIVATRSDPPAGAPK